MIEYDLPRAHCIYRILEEVFGVFSYDDGTREDAQVWIQTMFPIVRGVGWYLDNGDRDRAILQFDCQEDLTMFLLGSL